MKRIWVVDDMIPVHELYGALPVPTRLDSEIVLGLVNQVPRERWEEGEVLELCRSLCTPAFEAAFFRSPEAMLQAARQGAVPPHAVVFDWEYPGSNDERNLQALERLLLNSFAYVQVYTHLGGAAVDPKLVPLRTKFGARVLPAKAKAEVTPTQLAEQIRAAWAGTIAGELADTVRGYVLAAVERTLVDLCVVPTGALASMADGTSENLVHLVLSKVRDEIGIEGADALQGVLEASHAAQSNADVRRLMSVWYYFFPNDKRVRRGDVIVLSDGSLGLVVTPPCDLVRFPKKTGRRLTWLRTVPIDDTGLAKLRASGFTLSGIGNSIVASHPGAGDAIVVLPNVPLKEGKRDELADYAVLCHGWESREFAKAPGGALSYDNAEGITRRCTLAEPFVSSVIARITAVMSSPGVPDLPKGEIARLQAALAATPPAAAAAEQG